MNRAPGADDLRTAGKPGAVTAPAAPPHGSALQGRRGTPALLIRLLINLAGPVLAYVLLRPHMHSDITALVAGAAVPVAYTGGVLLWRRRLDAIGVFAMVCFGIGLLVVIATGGNELVFKLREDIWSGLVGLACLVSVTVRRPLFGVALRLAARRNADIAERASSPQARRISTVTTGVIGVILVVHALVIAALALTTSTTTFLVLKGPLSLAIVGGGVAALVFWIRRQYTSRANRPARRASDAGLNAGHAPRRPEGAGKHGYPAARTKPPAGADGNDAHTTVKEEGSSCPPSQSPEPTSPASKSAPRCAPG